MKAEITEILVQSYERRGGEVDRRASERCTCGEPRDWHYLGAGRCLTVHSKCPRFTLAADRRATEGGQP